MNVWKRFKEWWYAPVLKRLDEDDGPSEEYTSITPGADTVPAGDEVYDQETESAEHVDPNLSEYFRPDIVYFTMLNEVGHPTSAATLDLREAIARGSATGNSKQWWIELESYEILPIMAWAITWKPEYGEPQGRVYKTERGFKSALTQLGNQEWVRLYRGAVVWEETVPL
jgi:hypothetical protein